MRLNFTRYTLVATMVSLVLCVTVSFAGSDATVTGLITDQTGGVVPGASIVFTNINSNIPYTTQSNSVGIYSLPALLPGVYRANVAKDGFKSIVKGDIELHVQDQVSINFELQVGSHSESITVEGGAPLLNTQSGAVSTVVDQQFVQNMPLNGRSFQSLIAMTPGVVFVAASSMDQGQFSVNGQRTNANYFMVDGVSANFGGGATASMGNTWSGSSPAWTIAGGTNGLVSVDAMQEFRIETSTFAPEFGRTPGAQISIVTKSGSNAFHGNAFDYLRNDVLDARNFFNKVPALKPPLRQNDFGGTLGGPIVKDKTFFFFSYEGLRLRQPQTYVATGFLTAAARAKVAAVWKPWVNADPIPDGPVNANGITAPITLTTSLPSTLNATSIRVDHTLSSRISLFARYNHAPSNALGGYTSELRTRYSSNVDTATLGATFVISANKANDFRANWSRNVGSGRQFMVDFFGGVAPPESSLFPAGFTADDTQVYFVGSYYGATPAYGSGVRAGNFTNNIQRQLNLVDTFTWTVGKHSLKFGFDWRRMRPSLAFTPHSIGLYANYSDLLAGTLYFCYCGSAGANSIGFGNYSAYAQDTFKASTRLTLTYGLRWDVNPAPKSLTSNPIYNITGIFDSGPVGFAPANPLWHTQYTAFAPRVGAAYQVTPKTVVRGGFGVFYDLGAPGKLSQSLALAFPYSRSWYTMVGKPFTYSDPTQFQGPLFSLKATTDAYFTSAYDPNLSLPRTLQWNVAFERELGRSQSVTVSYVASKGQDLIRVDNMLLPTSVTRLQGISAVRNADWSDYRSMQVEFQRHMSHGLQALISYTLSKSTDTASNDGGQSVGGGSGTAPSVQAANARVGLNKGYSDFDVRHNFAGAFSYEVPSPFSGGIGRELLKGWALDGIVRVRSGLPMNVTAPTPVIINGVGQYVRPDVVAGQPFWIANPNAPGGKQLNPAAFAQPAGAFNGNFVRNSLRNFGLNQTDLALRRRFDLTERVKLDVRAEYFNLFNHPAFVISNLSLYSPSTFGIATNTMNVSLGSSAGGGGVSPQYGAGGPRSGQLTLKISF